MKTTLVLIVAALVCLATLAEAAPKARKATSPFAGAVGANVADADPRLPAFKTYWYTQTLDHFNFANTQTYQQRFLVVDEFWRPTHPILFYTGNEGDIMMFYNNTGLIFTFAKMFQAAVIFAEHRYYGQSLPFGQASFTPANMAWLTAEQALADYAQLLRWWKETNPKYAESPVVSFGGSYGGMLSAWFRMSYPHVVQAALASSAPVVQFVGEYQNYDAFNMIVTNDFIKSGGTCAARIRKGFKGLTAATSADYAALTKAFKLCSPIQNNNDVANLINYVENAVTYMAMTDYPDATNFLQPLPAWPVDASCRAAEKYPLTDVWGSVYAVTNVYYNTSGDLKCNDLNAPASGGLGDNAWNYQACSELVLPSTATGVADFFPPQTFIESEYTLSCQQQQGVTPRYRWIPLQYGGFNISAHSNIIFSNGNLDPWHAGGILTTIKPSLPAIMIDQGAHHLDLRFASANDPQSVIDARQKEFNYITTWLREWYQAEGIPSPV
jgi:lysosomal Pro-X carboxypeptidase